MTKNEVKQLIEERKREKREREARMRKQIKIFDEEDCCNRWLRDKDPGLIIDIKIESTAPYNNKVIMVIYMEEI